MGSSMFQAGDAERRQPPLLSIWSSLAVLSLTFVMPATVLNSKHYLVRQQRREASRGLASRGLPWEPTPRPPASRCALAQAGSGGLCGPQRGPWHHPGVCQEAGGGTLLAPQWTREP